VFKAATDKQVTLIEKILTERELYYGEYDRLWKRLEAHRINERTPGEGTWIECKNASKIIDWLFRNTKPVPRAEADGMDDPRDDDPAANYQDGPSGDH
jgi:hypothetical protein